ncbi:hypothetical protein AB833_18730 [Chromatiales bacterium (ex Bugula neritina AB1)]|nr:hypothetical protein AB833_18730 [Chromatiales bacterium (ex Bugula neritina AB1)]
MTDTADVGLDQPEYQYTPRDTALIIGAGLAGCAVARTLAKDKFNCKLFDSASTPAASTSAVPVAINQPHLTRTDQLSRRYYLAAFERMINEFSTQDNPSLYHQTGLLKLISKIDTWQDHRRWKRLTRTQACDFAGMSVPTDALLLPAAGWLNPGTLCKRWIETNSAIEFHGNTVISTLRKTQYGWQLIDGRSQVIDESRLVILCNGLRVNEFDLCNHLPLQGVRGQLSYFESRNAHSVPRLIVSAQGYVIPQGSGYWSGATHSRTSVSTTPCPADDIENTDRAKMLLPDLTAVQPVSRSWCGLRSATPDRFPIIGAAPSVSFYQRAYGDLHHGRRRQYAKAEFEKGLYLLTGFGSRGVVQSLLAAELLSEIIQAKYSQPAEFFNATHPARFLLRQLKRQSS